jgi:general secretion pathway protein G
MRGQAGFTLVELILVTVIIGILAGAVTLSFAGRSEEARIQRAKADIKSYETAIDLYALDNNDKYPTGLANLKGGKRDYVKVVKKDPWANPYNYVVPGKHLKYDLFSSGPDMQAGTDDDITNWRED